MNAFFRPNTKGLTNRRRLTALAYVVVLVHASLVKTRLKSPCFACHVFSFETSLYCLEDTFFVVRNVEMLRNKCICLKSTKCYNDIYLYFF